MEKLTQEEFEAKANKVHNFKYDYSETEYVNNHTKIKIRCKEHGIFEQMPYSHLMGNGCPECGNVKRLTEEMFLERANNIHNGKYKYYGDFISTHKKIRIGCPIHGDFIQLAKNHLKGQGCPECGKEYAKQWQKGQYEEFIKKSKERFGDVYEFPNIEKEFENSHSKIHFKCLRCGRVFEKRCGDHLTSPNGGCNCMNGNKSCLEKDVEKLLMENNIDFKQEKSFSWLHLKRLDFYIPKYNIAIECQGKQHFVPSTLFGGEEEFKKQIERDREKFNVCKEHGIDILYYTNQSVKSEEYNLLYEIDDLLKEIKKYDTSKEGN